MHEAFQSDDVVLSVLKANGLFSGCDEEKLVRTLLPGCRTFDYDGGEPIRRYDDPSALCILISGSASVLTLGEENDCLLRVLRSGDVFGVATLFAGTNAVTRILADEPTQVLIAQEEAVRALLACDSAFATNYVVFLSDRIQFLNRRLSCFGAGSATRRLVAWLDASIPEGLTEYMLPLPLCRLPDALGVSRASLYRALDDLETGGYILRNGKRIVLPDRLRMRNDFGL